MSKRSGISAGVNQRRLHRFAVFTALATFALLGAGGLVTSYGVGMAVWDWPNSYGYNMFFFPVSKWVGGIFYEHTHRLLASGVGLLTSVLALWLHGRTARPFMRWSGLALLLLSLGTWLVVPRRWTDAAVLGLVGAALLGASWIWPGCEPAAKWLRRLGLVAFFAVVLQGVLGGLRVVLLKDQIGIFHAALAQLFFVLLCAIALFTSSGWERWGASVAESGRKLHARDAGGLHWVFAATTILIFGQLLLGATMRHQHAGLAIPDFPLAYGKLWPAMDASSVQLYNERRMEVTESNPITAAQIGLQMFHRLLAGAILAAVAICAWSARRKLSGRHPASRLALLWLGLVLGQVFLGAATIWSNKAADIATAHVLLGALLLALGGILCIVSFREMAFARDPSKSVAAAPAASSAPFATRPAAASSLQ